MRLEELTMVVASVETLTTWTLCTPETAAAELERAEEYHKESLANLESICKRHSPDDDKFLWAFAELARERKTKYEIMPFDEYVKIEREKRLSGDLIKVTAEDYDYALNVLPPLDYCQKGPVTQFCMSEFDTGVYTTQYAYDAQTDTYYCKTVDAFDPSTWISEILYPAA